MCPPSTVACPPSKKFLVTALLQETKMACATIQATERLKGQNYINDPNKDERHGTKMYVWNSNYYTFISCVSKNYSNVLMFVTILKCLETFGTFIGGRWHKNWGGGTNLKCVLAGGTKGSSPPQTEKFAKDKKKLTPQLAVSLDSYRKFKFSLILWNFLNLINFRF